MNRFILSNYVGFADWHSSENLCFFFFFFLGGGGGGWGGGGGVGGGCVGGGGMERENQETIIKHRKAIWYDRNAKSSIVTLFQQLHKIKTSSTTLNQKPYNMVSVQNSQLTLWRKTTENQT